MTDIEQINHQFKVKNPQMASANARAEAVKELQNNHRDEWDQLYAAARERWGLDPEATAKTLTNQNRMLRYRIAELEQQLDANSQT